MSLSRGIEVMTADVAELLSDFRAIALQRHRAGFGSIELVLPSKALGMAASQLSAVRDYVNAHRPTETNRDRRLD
jgi:hypothetical protein